MRRALLVCVLFLAAAPSALAGASPPHVGVVTDAGHHGPGLAGQGASLFAANCAKCHGSGGGLAGQGPSLRNVGALAADFYLRTGYMPLVSPGQQPSRSRVLFTDHEIRAMVAYVATLGHGPAIPTPQPQAGSVSVGQKLFLDHCAGCHQIVAEGGYVTGARVPPLEDATDRQIAEAVRIGPYLMPKFPKSEISDAQLNSLIVYVDYAKHPDDAGGWSLGHLGPVPEGMVSWLIAGSALIALCLMIGRRLRS